jgi:hypothetical protein
MTNERQRVLEVEVELRNTGQTMNRYMIEP